MSEEDPFDIEQVPDALEAYKKQLDSLKEDIEVLILFSNQYCPKKITLSGWAKSRTEI
jgi:hypothetical protein